MFFPAINRGFLRLVLQRRPNTDLYFLLICQTLSVAMVTGILLFSNGIEQLIYQESARMMAADLVVDSSRPVPSEWRERLADANRQSAETNDGATGLNDATAFLPVVEEVRSANLMSMLFAGESMQLTDLRAVTDGYPLRGELTAIADEGAAPLLQSDSPAVGSIWLDVTSMRLLNASVGDRIEVGSKNLLFEKILHEEPGSALPGVGFSGRALMHFDDLLASELIQPGSRIEYQWMLAGPENAIGELADWLEPELSDHETLVSFRDGDERTQLILGRVRSYISLGSVMAVLLTGIAAMMTAARYMAGQQDRVAIMRALGAGRQSLLAFYLLQFGFYSLLALLLGYAIGYFGQLVVFSWLRDWIDVPIQTDPRAFIAGAVTALFCLLCFALPTVVGLLKTSPMRLLRAESSSTSQVRGILLFAVGFLALMVYYSGSWQITLWVYGAIIVLALIVWLVMRALVWLVRRLMSSPLSRRIALPLAMGLQSFCRQTQQVQLRTVLLASTVALLAATWILRSGLIDDWDSQVPSDAPNFFALDIAPSSVDELSARFVEANIISEPMYPVARARLVAFNGLEAEAFGISSEEALESLGREMVLTESATIPPGNTIAKGVWHGEDPEGLASEDALRVSVESGFASELGLSIGDRLQFSFAGQEHDFEVSSFRDLDWNSMKPNFFFVLEPPGIARLPYSHMTSFLAEETALPELEQIARDMPGMTLVDIGLIVERVRAILARVSLAVESIAVMTVVAGLLVVIASLRVSLRVRVQEFCIMRALGASQATLMGSLIAELAITGLVAAITGMLTASVLVSGIGRLVFDLQLLLPLDLWFLLPTLLLLLVVSVGYWVLRPVLESSPIQLWRSAV